MIDDFLINLYVLKTSSLLRTPKSAHKINLLMKIFKTGIKH